MRWPRQTARRNQMLGRIITHWGTRHRPTVLGCLWMAVLLGALAWLDLRRGGIFLVPPFAATMTILLYLPDVSIAQPFTIIFGSAFGAAIGTVLSLFLGFGPGVAMVAAITALIALPLLRAYHPPGVALAMYPPLLHPGLWFAIQVVLPFTLVAVISAALMSRLLRRWPQYPAPLRTEIGRTPT
jgi:CBS-domain-containing membrane protein